jgi:small-conductance mechanosensitive channel
VAATAEPKQVMEVLIRTSAAHAQVVKDPPPQAFLIKFGADAFNYELHIWTNEAVNWIHTRSDISVALNAALLKENIAIR